MTEADYAYAGLYLMGLLLGLLGIALIIILCRKASEVDSTLFPHHEDDSEIEEVPAYPPPPIHVTRFGIHSDHLKRGLSAEAGCPVCYELGLHLKKKEGGGT